VDGEVVRTPLYLTDSGERRRVTLIVADHMRFSGHKPGYVSDALTFGRSAPLRDASDELLDRRGVSLADAVAMRDEAFRQLEKRSQDA
jgi:hypothetical protein